MFQPKPFKFVCPKCGYSKIVKPKSDALSIVDMVGTCPKCSTVMEKKGLDALDKITSVFK